MMDSKLDEKSSVSENNVAPSPCEELYRPEVDTNGVDEKKLMRRVDLHIIPWLAVLYFLNFMDRGNIGNAKVISCIPLMKLWC